MNIKTKKTLLLGFIILLIVINISALTTIYYKSKMVPKNRMEQNNMKDQVHIRGMHRFIKEELNLSDEQFKLFQEVSRNNMIRSQEISFKLNDKRMEMMNEIAKINPNPKILDDIAHDIGELHYELKKNTIHHFLELKKICNADQQENLQKMFMQMIVNQDQDHNRMGRGPMENGRNRKGKNPRNN